MNTKEKGDRAERERKEMLESHGFLVEKAKRSGRFGSLDFWNTFDLICLRHDCILLEQVRSNKSDGAIKMVGEWARDNAAKLPENIKLQVAIRIDGKGGQPVRWRIVEVGLDE